VLSEVATSVLDADVVMLLLKIKYEENKDGTLGCQLRLGEQLEEHSCNAG
jgi:hypothetical protein